MTVTIEDNYPTRLLDEPADGSHVLDRKEPAVWSTPGNGPMNAGELASHERTGYTVVDGLLTPAEVQTYWQELMRLTNDAALRGDERVIVEKASNQVRSIFEVHKISGPIAKLVSGARVLELARQILGSDVYVHQSRVNFMPGFKGAGFYWHSDFETWHAEDGMPSPRAVSISIALTDNYPFNGGLMVMPGSHRRFVQCVGRTPDDHYKASLKEQEIGVPSQRDITMLASEYGIDQFTGSAGSALLFDSNIMHGSGNNITPFPRSNIFVVFNSVENTLVEPYAATSTRPTYIASRDFTAVQR